MIFYHVLAHIDFFQNNKFFSHTWDDDFMGKALSDKRRINDIREEMGEEKRFVDYVIEFSRGIDNLVNFYSELDNKEEKVDRRTYYFGDFLRSKDLNSFKYMKRINEYNSYVEEYGSEEGERLFFAEVSKRNPEFESLYERKLTENKRKSRDLLEFLINESEVVNNENNKWMKDVMQIVRDTSIYFQPQIRTKIINEGWASLVHDYLFRQDDRISSHESDYSVINAKVTANRSVGLNPYAIGLKLLNHFYDMGEKGKIDNYQYQSMLDIESRKEFDRELGKGWETLFDVRRNLNDFMLINFLDENDFQDFVTKNKLFVAGRKLNAENRT